MKDNPVFILASGLLSDQISDIIRKTGYTEYILISGKMGCAGTKGYDAIAIIKNTPDCNKLREECPRIFRRLKSMKAAMDVVYTFPDGKDKKIILEFAPGPAYEELAEKLANLHKTVTGWSDSFTIKRNDGSFETVLLLENTPGHNIDAATEAVKKMFGENIVSEEACTLRDNSKISDKRL